MSESLTIAPAPSLRSRLSFRQATSRPVMSAAPQAKGVRPRLRRLIMGPAGQPRWARPLLIALLVGTAALYLVDLSSSGMANEFYAAAVKSGSSR